MRVGFPNTSLIGVSEAEFLARAATPALCIDLDILRTNIDRMQRTAAAHRKALRPHMKAHKSSHIGALQLAAGAIGMSCATAKEARLAVENGLGSVLVTTPIVSPLALDTLALSQVRFIFAVDSVDAIDQIAAMGIGCDVVIDVNVGQNRTGVASAIEAERLKAHLVRHPQLTLRGIQAYYGHLQHVADLGARRDRIAAHWPLIVAASAAVGGDIITGGGTGTHLLDLAEGPFTEVQPGSYLFMDSQYGDVDLGDQFGVALSVLARVTSTTVPGQMVIDAGTKAISTDSAAMRFLTPGLDGATHKFMGDEHSAIALPAGRRPLSVGAPVRMAATHCDPTVNLHDHYHVFEKGRLVDIWDIEARGY